MERSVSLDGDLSAPDPHAYLVRNAVSLGDQCVLSDQVAV